jgi:hypothetical protein
VNDAVFAPHSEPGFEWVAPIDGGDWNVLEDLCDNDGVGWAPMSLRFLREEEIEGPRHAADVPWLGSGLLAMTDRAAALLGPLLTEDGVLLPAESDEGTRWIFHATRVIDALDEAHSLVEWLPSGKALRVTYPIFFPDRIAHAVVFRIPQFRRSPLYMTAGLVERITNAGLRGTRFEQVWPRVPDEPGTRPLPL